MFLSLVVIFGGVFVILSLFFTFYTVGQQTAALVERFGKFVRIGLPGLNLKIPWIEGIAGRINLRVQQLDVKVETKSEDNVFVHVVVSVQYHVLPDKIAIAFYRLNDPERQITSYVFDVVRAQVPQIKLDDVFSKKDEIAVAIKEQLSQVMDDFGYGIVQALVTDIDPDPKVKAAMNEINSAQRLRVAALEKGEADKIIKIKAAEADRESAALAGKGIAEQRMAIVDGLSESVDLFQKSVPGSTAQDVMTLVLMTQYFDALKDIGANSKNSTILIPHTPGTLNDLAAQMRDALISARQVPEAGYVKESS